MRVSSDHLVFGLLWNRISSAAICALSEWLILADRFLFASPLVKFRWEGATALSPGKPTVALDFKYDGPGIGKGGTGDLTVDGQNVATKQIPHTIPAIMNFDETFDIGIDTKNGVDDNDHQVPYRFKGTLNKVAMKLGPSRMQ